MRFLCRAIDAERYLLPIDLKSAPKSSAAGNGGHTEQAGLIALSSRPHILLIYAICDLPQIGNAIVCFVAINVVNLIFRPFSVNVKPREAVRQI